MPSFIATPRVLWQSFVAVWLFPIFFFVGAQLAGRDAEILLLKYTEGWNYTQVAAHLGISHAAVEARLHRARGRLKQELAALDVVEVMRASG